MKRVLGMFFLVIVSIMLGLSVGYMRDSDSSLVGKWSMEYGGVYE